VADGGRRDILEPLFEVQASYVAAAIDEVATIYGDIAAYFTDGLGIPPADQDELRQRLLP
jgi:protein-tyrosine phosphatase